MKNPEDKKYIKLGITGIAVLAAGLLMVFLLFRYEALKTGLKMVATVLKPFIYGVVIAYVLSPLCNKLERILGQVFPAAKKRAGLLPSLSILLSMLLALALVWVLVILVFPQVWESVVSIANAIPGELAAANRRLHDLLANEPELQAYWDEFSSGLVSQINTWLRTDLLPTVETVISGLGTSLAVFFTIIKNLFFGILISIYFLASRRQFAVQGRMLLHGIFSRRWARLIEEEILYADKMFNGFLMGKLLDSAIIGAICFAVTTLLGFRSAALISVVVGVTNIIPFFGPFIGAIPCALLLLLENPMHCVYFLIFVVILQQLDGNIIGPKILGNTTGLSSFWVLFSIILFGGLWGIAGMVVGVPLFAVLYDIIRRLTYVGLRKHDQTAMIEAYESAFHPTPGDGEASEKK